MTDYTNTDLIAARANAERLFNKKKQMGILGVQEGRLTKKEYYQTIRQHGLDAGVIEEGEYPGALPEWAETAFELGVGIPGYILAGGYGALRGKPQAYAAVGFGAGSGIGQAMYDSINRIFADDDQVVKPYDEIAEDALKTMGIDTGVSYGIDKTLKIGKMGFEYVKPTLSKAVPNILGRLGKQSKEKKDLYIKRFGDTDLYRQGEKGRQSSKQIKEMNERNLAEEGLTATRYQQSLNAGSLGPLKTGFADATSVVPGANIGGKEAYKNQVDDLVTSLSSKLDDTLPNAGRVANREPIIRSGSFEKNMLGEYEKKVLGKGTERELMPMHMIRNLHNLSAKNKKTYKGLYNEGDDLLIGNAAKGVVATDARFSLNTVDGGLTPGVTAEIQKLNQTLLGTEGKTTGVAVELPGFLRQFVQRKAVPFKYTGTRVLPATTKAVPEQLSGKEVYELRANLKNWTAREGLYSKNIVQLQNYDKAVKGGFNAIDASLTKSMAKANPTVVEKYSKANEVFAKNEQLMASNENIAGLAKGIEGSQYNKEVYDNLLENYLKATGESVKKIPTFSGRGTAKNPPTSEQVMDYYLKDKSGVQKLKNILVNKNMNAAEIDKGKKEFTNLMYGELENIFDKTLINNLRVYGTFDTKEFLKAIGHGPGAKLVDKEKIKQIIKDTQSLKSVGSKNLDTMQCLSYERLVKFGESIKGFQPAIDTSKFLMRRTALASSSGASLGALMPIAGKSGAVGVAGGAALFGIPAAVMTMGILNMFNRYMRTKVGQSYFASVRKDSKGVWSGTKKFFEQMMNSAEGKNAVSAQNFVGRVLKSFKDPRAIKPAVGTNVIDAEGSYDRNFGTKKQMDDRALNLYRETQQGNQ